jgi:23S rRNA (cytidine1920-2'-O)/16S rRNA (cytidine1409-2'-O)-methyltransferase
MTLRRLDAELLRRGLVSSTEEAHEAVDAGRVTVGGVPATKVATMVPIGASVEVVAPPPTYVSRAGEKLAAALDRFQVDPRGRECLDAGVSTGGFTDCLLQRGAARVIAVDVGYGQLAWGVRSDPRVHVFERTNIRDLTPDALPFVPDLVVADLSFLSLRGVLGILRGLASADAELIVLVKPQFEVKRSEVAAGGVVTDPGLWRRALEDVARAGDAAGLTPLAVMASPLPGPAGNVEFPMLLARDGDASALDVGAAILDGRALLR